MNLEELSYAQLAALATAITEVLVKDATETELSIYQHLFFLLRDNISLYLAVKRNRESVAEQPDTTDKK